MTPADASSASALLLAVIRGDDQRFAEDLEAAPRGAVALLPGLAASHGVITALHRALRGQDGVDTAVLQATRAERAAGAAVALRTQADLAHLGGTLNDAGASWAVLKGPALALGYHGDALARSYTDLDVLVSPACLSGTIDALEASGATLVDKNWPMIAATRRGELCFRLPGGTVLDLHWSLLTDLAVRRHFTVATEPLLSRSEQLRIGDREVPVLDPADTFLHVASHACLSGGWKLGWVLDVAAVACSDKLDWATVVERGRRTGLGLPAQVMLDRTQRLLGTDGHRATATLSAWRAALTVLERARPPVQLPPAHLSGRAVFSATRASTAASIAALSTTAARTLRRWQGASVEALHRPSGGPRERAEYLRAAVAEEAQAQECSG